MTGFISYSVRIVGLSTLLLAFILSGPDAAKGQPRYGPFPWTFPAEPDTTLVGRCEHGNAEAFLDVGNVRASIYDNGNLFWAGGPTTYEVPKGSNIGAIFNTNAFIGGLVEGELRVAGSLYVPYEFWPGPIVDSDRPPEDCSSWDRIWNVRFDDFRRHEIRPLNAPDDYRDWPTELGAPFIEVNGQAGYQPNEGDFPSIFGDQMLWWIMNDAGNIHVFSGSNPLGIEIRASAFAFGNPGTLGNTTFFRYEITNKTPNSIRRTYAGLFVDSDLGTSFDDYVGSDSSLGMMYFYNADNDDEWNYGNSPPAIGVTIIDTRSSSGRLLPGSGLTNTLLFFGGARLLGDPGNGSDLYNQAQSRWRDGKLVTLGGNGRSFSSTPVSFFYPGDPLTHSFWSEENIDNTGTAAAPSDRKIIGSYGPFDLDPGETITITYAFVWSRGASNLDSVRKLREDVAFIKSNAQAILTPLDPRPGFIDGNPPEDPGFPFSLWAPFPNPASDHVTLQFSSSDAGTIRMEVFDILGRRVATPFTDSSPDGLRRVDLDVSGWADGVYTVRLTSGLNTQTKRLLVVH